MSNITMAQPVPKTTAEYEAEFERLMAEADTIHEQMRRDRVGTEQLEMETQAIKADIARLKSETRAILARMGAQI